VVVDLDRFGIELEQVDRRRAEQPYVVPVEVLVRRVSGLQDKFKLETGCACGKLRDVESAQVNKEKFLAKRKVLE
jgi:hypothetical protein